MDKYYAMATEYFHTFEGKQFYPKLFSLQWGAWLVTGIAFAGLIGAYLWFRSNLWLIPMYAAEICFVLSSVWLDNTQLRQQKKHFGLTNKASREQLAKVKLAYLQRITQRPASGFAAMVKEIAELHTNQSRFAQPKINYWRLIYDPDSKARLVAITLSSLALFVALLSRTEDVPLPSLFALIASNKFGDYLIFLASVAAGLYVTGFGIYKAFMSIRSFVVSWQARWKWKAADDYVLQYFVSALIAQHDPLGKK